MKPNIIIVMADQQRADLRKSRGCPLDTMPFLDAWAQQGVDFNHAYTPNPICMAARISMFTGRYSQAHRARTNHNACDTLYTQDILDVLKSNGYTTALCGKNHSHHAESDFDFCESNAHLGGIFEGSDAPADIAFNEYLQKSKFIMGEGEHPAPGGVEVQFPYKNVNSALKFIDSVEQDTPFFAWVSFAEPHNPYQVPEPYYDMFPPKDLPPCVSAQEAKAANKGARFERMRSVWEQVYQPDVEATTQRCRSNYYGMLRLIDDQFKRLIEGLNERNIADNTIVIYLSDHGDFAGEYGLMRKGGDLSNLLSNIPMVWGGYGVDKIGKEATSYASIIDIFPTLCDMIDTEIPLGVQGKSLVPILQQKQGFEKEFEWAYIEGGHGGLYWTDGDALTYVAEGATKNMTTFDCLNTWTQCGQVRSLCYKDYRLQIDMMGTGYLYHLATDPMELKNLWDDPATSEIKMELLEKIMMANLQACDILPFPHTRYRTKIPPKGYWYQDIPSEDVGVRNLPKLENIQLEQ